MDPQEAKPNGTPALDRSWAFRRTAVVAVAAIALGIWLAVWSGQSTRVVRVVVAVRVRRTRPGSSPGGAFARPGSSPAVGALRSCACRGGFPA